ncbi:hypothetical protein T4B_11238 [Trichinella pseudospiralis]|uniref:Uncharacterized protein n=1 Tax=Trichinella pseudospiralis TaxID=6337 RepID=A0A0V1GLJ2_TRIPS|nr:hypothetical protein T4B_11238 [Trichinella pseudospiralis]
MSNKALFHSQRNAEEFRSKTYKASRHRCSIFNKSDQNMKSQIQPKMALQSFIKFEQAYAPHGNHISMLYISGFSLR